MEIRHEKVDKKIEEIRRVLISANFSFISTPDFTDVLMTFYHEGNMSA
jgi:hypothetical protein